MKKFLKRTSAILLALLMLSGTFTCFAYDFGGKDVSGYKNYVLLGDSIASGWSDVETIESRFTRVNGSYGAYVADDLGVENYYPMACIGFRTVEMRYILEEDYEPDRFLYYSIDKEKMDTVYAPAMIEAITNADLITLNVGGNDWGSFLGWHVFEELDKAEIENEEFLAQLEEYLVDAEFISFDTVVEIASYCNAIPELVQVLPAALKTGLENYFVNWNYMIEDIYALNPDVTLLVIGMFDNSLQDPESPYVSTDGGVNTTNVLGELGQTIIDVANIPMIEGANKYGYIFVDTTGTLCEEHHPSRTANGGHRFIANKILEALPDSSFPFTDVDKASKDFTAVEYMYRNGIMGGKTATEFAPDEAITSAELEDALFAITGVEGLSKDSDSKVNRFALAFAVFNASQKLNTGITGFAKSFSLLVSTIFDAGPMGIISTVTRAQAANSLMHLVNM